MLNIPCVCAVCCVWVSIPLTLLLLCTYSIREREREEKKGEYWRSRIKMYWIRSEMHTNWVVCECACETYSKHSSFLISFHHHHHHAWSSSFSLIHSTFLHSFFFFDFLKTSLRPNESAFVRSTLMHIFTIRSHVNGRENTFLRFNSYSWIYEFI